ncbi:hypothetical protein PIB30_075440 [Stylosanthes scabra]|uniref:At2g35280-like TPR domain-containing protein n=1 Tax=Stylosanthes scabra TaxID=79078 RepID=A0ABU6UNQ2_9FABA|nr:hypothetical protein [Stylosanthes scabra]
MRAVDLNVGNQSSGSGPCCDGVSRLDVPCSHALHFTPAKFPKLLLRCFVCLGYLDRLSARRRIGFTWLSEYKLLIPKPTGTLRLESFHFLSVPCSHPLHFTPAKFPKLPLWCFVCLGYPDRLLAQLRIGFTWLPEYKLLIPKPTALVMMGVIPEVKVLPEEVWVHIATLVAKELFPDLLTMKLTCKFFRSIAESDEVYKHARLVKLPPYACLRFLDKSERLLIKRCLQSGNPEAMFLKGHQQYFSVGEEVLRLELLSAAALNGHVESKYLHVMLLMCNEEGEESRRQGADSFKEVYASGELRKCRERIRGLLCRVWWVENTPSTPEQPASCRSTTFPTRGSMPERYREHHLNPQYTGDVDVSCDFCRADYEMLVLSEILSAEED